MSKNILSNPKHQPLNIALRLRHCDTLINSSADTWTRFLLLFVLGSKNLLSTSATGSTEKAQVSLALENGAPPKTSTWTFSYVFCCPPVLFPNALQPCISSSWERSSNRPGRRTVRRPP